jgi:hypothetical protein
VKRAVKEPGKSSPFSAEKRTLRELYATTDSLKKTSTVRGNLVFVDRKTAFSRLLRYVNRMLVGRKALIKLIVI